jgi:hypothetical protein
MGALYEQTEWLPAQVIAVAAAGFALAAAILRQPALLPMVLISALIAALVFTRVALHEDRLTVTFGIARIPVLRLPRSEVQSARVYMKRWDGVNWPVRRIADVVRQEDAKGEPGVLLRTARGELWLMTRRAAELQQALVTYYALPREG